MQTQRMWLSSWKQAKPVAATLAVAGALLLIQGTAIAVGPAPVDLGTAAPFAILSSDGITAVNNGLVVGDVGATPAPGSAIDVMDNQVQGTIYATDSSGPLGAVVNPSLLSTAAGHLSAAYNSAATRTPVPTGAFMNPGSGNIGGTNFGPGLYKFTDAASIVGLDLTLTGGPNDVWIFQITSSLYLGQGVYINLAGGAQAKNVFWQVGSTVLLDEFSYFRGTILADQSITMMTNASVDGRALSVNGSVAFGGSDISVPVVSPWSTAVNVGGGWKWLGWFGYFYDDGGDWIYHQQHGWMYTASTSSSSLWFWTSDLGWIWTSSTMHPYFYRSSTGIWLWYQVDSDNPRWFYSTETGLWESH